MSNKTQLQTNNANLDALIIRVNAAKDVAASLPNAGGGPVGGLQTCTVQIKCSQEYFDNAWDSETWFNVTYLKLKNGALSFVTTLNDSSDENYHIASTTDTIILEDVLCNSLIFIFDIANNEISWIKDKTPYDEVRYPQNGGMIVFLGPEYANSTVTLTFTIE